MLKQPHPATTRRSQSGCFMGLGNAQPEKDGGTKHEDLTQNPQSFLYKMMLSSGNGVVLQADCEVHREQDRSCQPYNMIPNTSVEGTEGTSQCPCATGRAYIELRESELLTLILVTWP